jgi:hypothetical protein
MDSRQKKVHYLLHTLWTKAAGSPRYEKDEWRQMSNYIYALLAEPEASTKIGTVPDVVPPPTRFEREDII